MGCIFRPRLNSIWSIWYTVLLIGLNAYMINLGLRRYKLYTEIKWPHGAYPHLWLTVYVTLYGACFPLCVLFFAFGVFKSGNLAGDHEVIAARYERTLETTKSTKKSCCFRFIKTTWMHCPPLPQTIHIILALCQMVAHQVMLAQLYRFGYINSGEFLNTELDFIFTRTRQLVSNLPMGDTRLQAFKLSTDELNTAPLSPRILPVLMHARLFGIHLETLNFIIAVLCFACAYPAVFSRISKWFSFFFSIHLIFFAVDLFFTYIEFSILFRIQETNKYSVRPIGLGQYLPGRFFPEILFDPLVILGLFVATVAVSLTGPIIIYYYGYQQYQIFLKNFLAKSRRQMRNSSKESPLHPDDDAGPSICCNGYAPNAMATFYLIILALLKAPAIGGCLEIYDKEPKLLLLTCILISATYLFFWLIFWLALTCKSNWNLRVLYNVQEIVNLQGAHKFEATHGKSPSELKDALVMIFEDRMYVTDDALARQSLIRHAMKTTHDEVYWMRGNQSPTEKRVVIDDGRDPETIRLIDARHQSVGNQMTGSTPPSGPLSYNQSRSLRGLPPHPPHVPMTDDRFGTFQRPAYASGMLNHQTATLGRHSTTNLRHPETYASINRSLHHGDLNYAGFNHGQMELSNNAHYASYSRMPMNRPQPQAILSQGIYGSRQASEPIDGTSVPAPLSMQGSPLMQSEEMKSHYQRASALSSFNNGPRLNSAPRLPPTGQSNYSHKPTISASSSQQDSCLTPTSTTTNNGSSTASTKQVTPTVGSPNAPNGFRYNGISGYGRNNPETRGGSEPHQPTGNYGTLTKSSVSTGSASRITTGPIRMPIKSTTVSITQRHDDSANFSLSSSNESDGHGRKINSNINDPEYATSVV